MKKTVLLVLASILCASGLCSADDLPLGNLTVDPTVVYAGDPVAVYVEGADDIGVVELWASYDGTHNWHRFDCAGLPAYCNHTWTWSPLSVGTHDIEGYVRDDAGGRATQPAKIVLTVLSATTSSTSSSTTTSTEDSSTTTSAATSSTTVPPTTTTTIPSTTTTTNPRDYLGVMGNFANYVVCTLMEAVWLISAGLGAIIIIFAGIRYLSSDDAESREKAKKTVINVFAALVIIFVAVPTINYFVRGTDVAEISCANRTGGPPVTIAQTTTTTSSTSLPENMCSIKGVYIGGILYGCGSSDGVCPELFNPLSGGCPPGSETVCSPADADC